MKHSPKNIRSLRPFIGKPIRILDLNGKETSGQLVKVSGHAITLKEADGKMQTKALFTLLAIGGEGGYGGFGYPYMGAGYPWYYGGGWFI